MADGNEVVGDWEDTGVSIGSLDLSEEDMSSGTFNWYVSRVVEMECRNAFRVVTFRLLLIPTPSNARTKFSTLYRLERAALLIC